MILIIMIRFILNNLPDLIFIDTEPPIEHNPSYIPEGLKFSAIMPKEKFRVVRWCDIIL